MSNPSDRDAPGKGPAGRQPLIAPAPDVLARHNARVLDPVNSVRLSPDEVLLPTVYVSDSLIVSPFADDATRHALEEAARRNHLQLVGDLPQRALRAPVVARDLNIADEPHVFSVRVRLIPAEAGPAVPADAWNVLQTFRAIIGRETTNAKHVGLDHLLGACAGPDIGGSPYLGGHGIGGSPYLGGHGVGGVPYLGGHGVDSASSEYGAPGFGGRAPVAYVGPAPYWPEQLGCRRPVVAVLDTGVGVHPWLPEPIVQRNAMVGNHAIGIHDHSTDPDGAGVVFDPYEGVLDSDSGHGTFISGLIRQRCPSATILAIRVMYSDGVVPESVLLDVLSQLLLRQRHAQRGNPADAVDVISMSLGYYHEQPKDFAYDSQLFAILDALSRAGVAVVASAGNDSTAREMFPAAFTPWSGGRVSTPDRDCVPLLSVGAENPNGTTALFSNAGKWVACRKPGAAVMSTLPTSFNASVQATYKLDIPSEGVRETIDMDDFSGGFGTWSGTSFAAPILAGDIAQQLLAGGCGPVDPIDAPTMVARTWNAVSKCVPELTRP